MINAQLEKFFYQGLEHKGVQLPAAINFAHYTHGTGQVRSNTFVNNLWQYREFKADIQPLKPLTNLNLDSFHQQKDHPMSWI
jgi:hypothetical protein